jgi:4-amino-4-deoxy-L-arabinose transferase-like glycosyltransferase
MPPAAPPPPATEDPLLRRGPALAAVATFILHALAWDRYGVFRDELYFVACGQRLDWGYVDQPPGIPALAALAHAMFGTWVPGLRVFAWLAAAGAVYLTGRLAVRLGARGHGAVIASIAALASPVLLGLGHLLTMNAFEVLLMVALAHVLVTIVKGESPRRWVGAAVLAALAVLFKYSAALLSLALLAGLLLTPERRALRSIWLVPAAILALALVAPNLAWQAQHGFPFLELVRNGQRYKNAPFDPLGFSGALVLEGGPLTALVWTGGLGWLLLTRAGRPFRFLGLGAAIYLAVLVVTRGKSYYFASALPVLMAAGAVAWEARLRAAPRLARAAVPAALALQLALAPLAVPLLPEGAFVRYQAALGVKPPPMERDRPGLLPQVYADMHGWAALAEAVARAHQALPEAERLTAVVFGQNYGQAAAVDVLGAGRGLPPAVSGHNQYWLWGLPAGRGDPAIVIGDDDEDCGGVFRERVLAERLPSDPWVRPAEDARTIWICRGATSPIEAVWPRLRHYE